MTYSLWLMDVVYDEFRADRDVPVRPVDGWETRGRDYADHQGVMDHHIGGAPGSSYAANLNYIVSGASFAPAANLVTGSPYAPDRDDFPIHVVAAGRANHAGVGSLDWMGGGSGSTLTVGIEHYSTWDHVDWHPRHLEIQMRLDACLLEHMGQTWRRRCDHKEYATPAGRKTDRHHIDTVKWDLDLAELMITRSIGDDPTGGLTMAEIDAITAQLVAINARLDALPKSVWDDLHPHARVAEGEKKEKAWQVLNRIRVSNKVVLNRVLESVRVNAERGGTPDEIAKRVRAELASALDI